MEKIICYVKEKYFIEHKDFIKMLDPGKTKKQSKRAHACVVIEKGTNKCYIPLRNNLGKDVRKFGRIGHYVPSSKRPNAGLDFRYTLIIQDEDYIEHPDNQRIPNSQLKKIESEYETIKKEFLVYIKGFEKCIKKHREHKEPLYKESSLLNYIDLFIKK